LDNVEAYLYCRAFGVPPDGLAAPISQLIASRGQHPAGWYHQWDAYTGSTYYFDPASGRRCWELPAASCESTSQALDSVQPSYDHTGQTFYEGTLVHTVVGAGADHASCRTSHQFILVSKQLWLVPTEQDGQIPYKLFETQSEAKSFPCEMREYCPVLVISLAMVQATCRYR
jgi:hypothetical protein